MIVTNKKKPNEKDFQVKINDKCSLYKYLGVHIDENLSWIPHINYFCEKNNQSMMSFSQTWTLPWV